MVTYSIFPITHIKQIPKWCIITSQTQSSNAFYQTEITKNSIKCKNPASSLSAFWVTHFMCVRSEPSVCIRCLRWYDPSEQKERKKKHVPTQNFGVFSITRARSVRACRHVYTIKITQRNEIKCEKRFSRPRENHRWNNCVLWLFPPRQSH